VKNGALVTILCLFLMPAAALADTMDFNAPNGGPGNFWNWNGTVGAVGSTVTGSSGTNGSGNILSADYNGCDWQALTCNPTVGLIWNGQDLSPQDWLGGSTLSFTSGALNGGSGTVLDPYTFSAGGTITVSNDSWDDCGGPCFTGSFTDAQLGVDSSGNLVFSGYFVGGTVSPTLTSLLDQFGYVAEGPYPTTGSFTVVLMGSSPCSGEVSNCWTSGDLSQQSTVPEPGTLMLFGTGLLSMAGFMRRKLMS
jgi:PEP-CTERM motif